MSSEQYLVNLTKIGTLRINNMGKAGNFNGKYKSINEIPMYNSYPVEHNNAIERPIGQLISSDEELLAKVSTLQKPSINIVELGCETCCRIYHMLNKHSTSIVNKYYGVDLEEIIATSTIKTNENVLLTTSVYDIQEKVDIFYSNSALQYVLNPYECLTHIFTLCPTYIIFNRTPFTTDDEFITLQLFSGRRFPWTFFGIEKFVSFFESNGYKLESKEVYQEMNMENTTNENLCFKKINNG